MFKMRKGLSQSNLRRYIFGINHISACRWKTFVGDYSIVKHLFPFRTEKLSTIALMILVYRESKSLPTPFKVLVVLLQGLFFCL
jgi:hypothetical protein